MKITIKGYWIFKRFLDSERGVEIDVEQATLQEALAILALNLGEEFDRLIFDEHSKKVKRSNLILLNGQNYLNLSRKTHTPLKDGDEIKLVPMVTGG